MLTDVGTLMGQAEIADRLGVTRQRVQQLIARPDWPTPYEVLAMGKVWLAEDVERWIAEHRPADHREPRPDDAPPLGRRHQRGLRRTDQSPPPPAPPGV
jgi:hypothetical protein